MSSLFEIDGRRIGSGQPPYVIAEISGNHNGDKNQALRLMEMAHEAGAQAVKLQSYTADSMTIPSKDEDFVIDKGLWAGWRLYDLYDTARTSYEWLPDLFKKGRDLGITVFSSPFDPHAVDILERHECPAYKIASNELTDWYLVKCAAETGKPLILSTGTAELDEIEQTVKFLRRMGTRDFALLHCISAYPSPITGMNLATISDIGARLGVPVGLSDHSIGSTAAVTAVALGACIIEKHITLDRNNGGPDSAFSSEPEEFRQFCQSCSDAHASLGKPCYGMREVEKESPIYRRFLYTSRDISDGEVLGPGNIRTIRARQGIAAMDFEKVFGRKASCDIPRNTPLTWERVSGR